MVPTLLLDNVSSMNCSNSFELLSKCVFFD